MICGISKVYLPIGGHIEDGETIDACVIRETKEESGITVNKVTLKGIVYVRGHAQGSDDNVLFSICFIRFRWRTKNRK